MRVLNAITGGEIYNKIYYEGSCITDDLYEAVSAHHKELWRKLEENEVING